MNKCKFKKSDPLADLLFINTLHFFTTKLFLECDYFKIVLIKLLIRRKKQPFGNTNSGATQASRWRENVQSIFTIRNKVARLYGL